MTKHLLMFTILFLVASSAQSVENKVDYTLTGFSVGGGVDALGLQGEYLGNSFEITSPSFNPSNHFNYSVFGEYGEYVLNSEFHTLESLQSAFAGVAFHGLVSGTKSFETHMRMSLGTVGHEVQAISAKILVGYEYFVFNTVGIGFDVSGLIPFTASEIPPLVSAGAKLRVHL